MGGGGKGRQVRCVRERDSEGDDEWRRKGGGRGRGAEGKRWLGGSGSVSASVFAVAGFSSSACRVGKKNCVCKHLHDNSDFEFVCV